LSVVHHRLLGLLLAVSVAAASAAEAPAGDPAPQALFEQMAKATRERNYEGIFVYARGSHADSMRIFHRADASGEQERIVSLSGPLREVIRSGTTVKCFYPDTRSVFVEKSAPRKFLPSFNTPTDELLQNYKFAMVGRDRVADRRAWVVAVLPRTAFRYGYRFWIDAESSLLLRSEVVNSQGTALEQIVFTELNLPDAIDEAALKPSTDGSDFTWYDKGGVAEGDPVAQVAAATQWQVKWVPDGFSQREYKIQRLAASEQPVEHFVFSDGLATISVFIERLAQQSDSLQGFTSIGAVNTFSTLANDFQITVVGEVPPLTVRQVAGSVQMNRAAATQ
jgi:sigma-E factor negative regulatory protein RseB